MTPKKILIIKPSSLGDIIHSLPFLNVLRKCFPQAELHWVVAKGFHELLEAHPMIDRLWVMSKDQWKRLYRLKDTAKEIKTFLGLLRKERFDVAVDLQGLLRSGLITAATGAKMRVGFEEAREGSTLFYNYKVKGGRDIHAVMRYLKIAEFLGCTAGEVAFPFPPLPEDSPVIRQLPDQYIVIAPSAGKEANRWPARRFGELARRLPFKSVVVAGKTDSHIAHEVVNASGGMAISLAGKTTLKELALVIKGAEFFVSNDTGPMHIAAAFGIPVFAIFGPANPLRTGPYGSIHTVIRQDMSCSPCYRKRKCRDWKCMEALTVDMVLDAILSSKPLQAIMPSV